MVTSSNKLNLVLYHSKTSQPSLSSKTLAEVGNSDIIGLKSQEKHTNNCKQLAISIFARVYFLDKGTQRLTS